MALDDGLFWGDVLLRNYSLTHPTAMLKHTRVPTSDVSGYVISQSKCFSDVS